jgi:L-threonate 2-dehydrogenase
MKPVVAVVAQGSMGAGISARLVAKGARVLTSLEGRSEASVARAKKAGVEDVSDEKLAGADFFLSIVPPKDALALTQRFYPVLAASNKKPVYVDCNAISPQSANEIGAVIDRTGAPFVDGGIIGGPPREGYTPILYVSGAEAARVQALNEYGLDVRLVEGGDGAASALKMSYAAIAKGLTAIGAASILAAQRTGVGEALYRELTHSRPDVLAYLTRSVPDMFPKAYRWVAEMEEIGDYTGNAEEQIFDGMAGLYERLASDSSNEEIETLRKFFQNKKS